VKRQSTLDANENDKKERAANQSGKKTKFMEKKQTSRFEHGEITWYGPKTTRTGGKTVQSSKKEKRFFKRMVSQEKTPNWGEKTTSTRRGGKATPQGANAIAPESRTIGKVSRHWGGIWPEPTKAKGFPKRKAVKKGGKRNLGKLVLDQGRGKGTEPEWRWKRIIVLYLHFPRGGSLLGKKKVYGEEGEGRDSTF